MPPLQACNNAFDRFRRSSTFASNLRVFGPLRWICHFEPFVETAGPFLEKESQRRRVVPEPSSADLPVPPMFGGGGPQQRY